MKYIIELPEEPLSILALSTIKGIPKATKIETFEPYTEPDQKAIDLQHAHDIENVARMNYSKGAEDAWELARLISLEVYDGGLNRTDLNECYKSVSIQEVMKNYSYQEAKAKYDAWRAERDEIHVGDEVEYDYSCNDSVKFVVIGTNNGMAYGFKYPCETDDVGEYCELEDIRRTGRSFPEIVAVLKKMREES